MAGVLPGVRPRGRGGTVLVAEMCRPDVSASTRCTRRVSAPPATSGVGGGSDPSVDSAGSPSSSVSSVRATARDRRASSLRSSSTVAAVRPPVSRAEPISNPLAREGSMGKSFYDGHRPAGSPRALGCGSTTSARGRTCGSSPRGGRQATAAPKGARRAGRYPSGASFSQLYQFFTIAACVGNSQCGRRKSSSIAPKSTLALSLRDFVKR